jgi:hypothetical protein
MSDDAVTMWRGIDSANAAARSGSREEMEVGCSSGHLPYPALATAQQEFATLRRAAGAERKRIFPDGKPRGGISLSFGLSRAIGKSQLIA